MLALAFITAAFAGNGWECVNDLPVRTSTALDTDGHTTKYTLQTDGYDPNPLLYTTIEVKGEKDKPACLTAVLSLHNLNAYGYGDINTAVKVTVDGNAMYGHTTACTTGGVNVPCVLFHLNTDGNTFITGNSYSFSYPVLPGYHRVQVFYAGDGDGDADPGVGAYVGGTVLTLFHP